MISEFLKIFRDLEESSKDFLTSSNIDLTAHTEGVGVPEKDVPDMIYLLETFPNYFVNIELKMNQIKK